VTSVEVVGPPPYVQPAPAQPAADAGLPAPTTP